MVRVRDEGSEFDAPIEVVWRFLSTPEVHQAAHRGERNQRVELVHDNTFLSRSEVLVGDQWVPLVNRVSVFPPIASVVETIKGPWTGSILVHVYTPSGRKTRVDVYGEFVLPGTPDAQAEQLLVRVLSELFEMHNEEIRKFARRP